MGNPQTPLLFPDRKKLQERAAIIRAVRSFFVENGYLEVETPIRLPAVLPESCIEPVRSGEWFLQSSPEQCMKRLLAAGWGRIFQICRCFRANERGRFHLPEMTMLEWYAPEMDQHGLMDECERLFAALVPAGVMEYQGAEISLAPPWPRLSLARAFDLYADISLDEAMAADCFEETLCRDIEPRLGMDKPLFLTDYPAEMASLAALDPKRPDIAQRFELYVAGVELANGYTELVNPVEQRHRFLEERQEIQAAGADPGPMPERFLRDLGRMPPAAGIALGLDRLVMLLADSAAIDQVVAFAPEEL